jgi:hypothetical protein
MDPQHCCEGFWTTPQTILGTGTVPVLVWFGNNWASISEACQSAADSRRCTYVNNFQVRFGNYWLGKVKLLICDGFSFMHTHLGDFHAGLDNWRQAEKEACQSVADRYTLQSMCSSAIFWLALLQWIAK